MKPEQIYEYFIQNKLQDQDSPYLEEVEQCSNTIIAAIYVAIMLEREAVLTQLQDATVLAEAFAIDDSFADAIQVIARLLKTKR